jgi:hypothetical protein
MGLEVLVGRTALRAFTFPTILRKWTSTAATLGKRVRFIGDHRDYHCGSAAVSDYIFNTLQEHGFSMSSGDYDILLVNGEGSMCLGCRPFHKKMGEIRTALKQGKRVHLVNTVWNRNPYDYDPLLPRLCSIVARDVLSQNELRMVHGVESRVFLDFSFFSALRPSSDGVPNYGGKIVMTDFKRPRSREFVRHESEEFAYIDMRDNTWSNLVMGLKSASILVTGRHHAVCAAIRARVPFVALPGNSHKIEGLLATANVPIPLIHSLDEIPAAVDRVSSLASLYRELFDWAQVQPKWTAESLLG